MGKEIEQSSFTEADYRAFTERLSLNLDALKILLARPGFGEGASSLGAELEISLIDDAGNAKWLNQLLLEEANDPQLTLELNRYNLEYNLSPVMAAGKPFSKIAQEMNFKLNRLTQVASSHQTRLATIGILPTLTQRDISRDAMTDCNRYSILQNRISELRGYPFRISIEGEDPVVINTRDMNAEGANTSFQVHLRVPPKQFADLYNAAQIVTPLALAVSTNSPIFLGHRLWEETRIPLFKQAVETRSPQAQKGHRLSRTGMGAGWLKDGAFPLFEQSVNFFDIIIPECSDEYSLETVRSGGTPQLKELKLHHGSTWHWNRAIYDPAENGHLRIEFRALPSGPTYIDMVASAAFLIGLTQGLHSKMQEWTKIFPFKSAKDNFYRAAQMGMDTELLWPSTRNPGSLEKQTVPELVTQLLPTVASGLAELGVDEAEIQSMLSIIEGRIETRMTGARWQLKMFKAYSKTHDKTEALHFMLEAYLQQSEVDRPVHEWSSP